MTTGEHPTTRPTRSAWYIPCAALESRLIAIKFAAADKYGDVPHWLHAAIQEARQTAAAEPWDTEYHVLSMEVIVGRIDEATFQRYADHVATQDRLERAQAKAQAEAQAEAQAQAEAEAEAEAAASDSTRRRG